MTWRPELTFCRILNSTEYHFLDWSVVGQKFNGVSEESTSSVFRLDEQATEVTTGKSQTAVLISY